MPVPLTPARALREHWPEYLIEGWALAVFMISAGVFTIWFEQPDMPLHHAITNPNARRALVGVAMGATAMLLIYSPWGKRSGAHMNPAVTFAFLTLRRVAAWDAVFYALAQFTGGCLGVLAVWGLYGSRFSAPPVAFIATLPGPAGVMVAFIAELCISLLMMLSILFVSDSSRYSRYTGVIAGVLVASYVTLEAPLSGFSMNPARTFASAFPGGAWHAIWVYFTAPFIGMGAATFLYRSTQERSKSAMGCAKLHHAADVPCIHCGNLRPSVTVAILTAARPQYPYD